MKIELFLVVIVALIFSCSSELDIEEYLNYIHDSKNGLTKTKDGSRKEYTLKLRPLDLMVFQELRISNKSKNTLTAEIEGLEYYQLLIKNKNQSNNVNDKASFYYAFEFQKDIVQIVNRDTIQPSLYLLEQGIQGLQNLSINLGFEKDNSGDFKILVKDKYGDHISFQFKKEDLSNLPNLDL